MWWSEIQKDVIWFLSTQSNAVKIYISLYDILLNQIKKYLNRNVFVKKKKEWNMLFT